MAETLENSSGTAHGQKESVSNARSYTYPTWYRGSAVAMVGATVLGAGVVTWLVIDGREDAGAFAAFTAVMAVNALQAATEFLSTYRLTGELLRVERPLADDREVRYADVARVLIGGKSVEVHVASDAPSYAPGRSTPDFQISRDIQDAEQLIQCLVDQLPPTTIVENPSGEFADLCRPAEDH